MAVGYGIEDKIIPIAHKFALKRYNIISHEVKRTNIRYSNGKYDEVNILIKGKRADKDIYLVGECKAQPGKKDLDKFTKLLDRLKNHFAADIQGFFIGYHYNPEVEDYAEKKFSDKFDIFRTYEIEMIANS